MSMPIIIFLVRRYCIVYLLPVWYRPIYMYIKGLNYRKAVCKLVNDNEFYIISQHKSSGITSTISNDSRILIADISLVI